MDCETSDCSNLKIKMLFFPFLAQGHILPMLSMANLFAARRGVHTIILTTPANATSLHHNLPPSVSLHLIPFPSSSLTGLPANCENVYSLPDMTLISKFFSAVKLLQHPFADALSFLRPDCVVTDMFFPWTYSVAAEMGIPRIVFHGTSIISQSAFESLHLHRTVEDLPLDAQTFEVPGVPGKLNMCRSQLPEFKRPRHPVFLEIERQRHELDAKSFGVLFNSFYGLESEYADYYRNVLGMKAWLVGPISLSSAEEKASRSSCLEWLDDQRRGRPAGSVLYICFGSVELVSKRQLHEIALALEACRHPFIWVVRNGGGEGNEDWIPRGFEERIGGRGLIIRGWAPQVSVLNHVAVGGFMTHCGWNSSLEGISAGVPMVTWPLFGDQFYNEKLIVDVLEIGVSIGTKEYDVIPEERTIVEAEKIKEGVENLMGVGEDAEGRRWRAKELGKTAKMAVGEGGSSYADVGNLIQELIDLKSCSELH